MGNLPAKTQTEQTSNVKYVACFGSINNVSENSQQLVSMSYMEQNAN